MSTRSVWEAWRHALDVRRKRATAQPTRSETVRLRPPVIESGRITFSWKARSNLPCFLGNSFYVQYPEDLSVYSVPPDLLQFVSIGLLSQQLSMLAPVRVILEEPVDPSIPAFWTRVMELHHRVDPYDVNRSRSFQVKFRYRENTGSLSDSSASRQREVKPRNCVMYGGGKDGLAQVGMLRELFPGEPLLGITIDDHAIPSYFSPLCALARYAPEVEPLRLETNIKQILRPIGIVQWPLLALPLLYKRGITHCHWGTEANVSRFVVRDGVHLPWKLHTSQVLLAALSRVMQRRGWPTRVLSLLTPISTYASQLLLAARYPELLQFQRSCSRGSEEHPYCNACAKCLQIALAQASLGLDPASAGLDLAGMLASPKVRQWVFHPSDKKPELKLISNLAEQVSEYAWTSLVSTRQIDKYLTTPAARENYAALCAQNMHSRMHGWVTGHLPAALPYVLDELPSDVGERYRQLLGTVLPAHNDVPSSHSECVISPTEWRGVADWLSGTVKSGP